MEDGLVFAVDEEVFFIDFLARSGRVDVPLRALHALRWVVVMTVLFLFLIVHACSTARIHSMHTRVPLVCNVGFL